MRPVTGAAANGLAGPLVSRGLSWKFGRPIENGARSIPDEFPDAITSRGTKHLKTLIEATKKGYKTYLLFLIQIQGIENFKIAKDIDKEYYKNYLLAKKAGVNFLAYRCKISSKEIKIEKRIKISND